MFKSGNPSVLQIDGDTVRVLTVKKNKADFSMVKAFEIKLGNISELPLKLEKKSVSLLFPRELSVMRTLEISDEKKESIPAAIASEIEDGLPFAKETVSWDSVVTGKIKNKNSLLFAATSSGSINEYAKKLLNSGFSLETIIPSSIALYEAFRISKSYTKEPVLILAQGNDRVDIIVIENDVIIASRGFKTKEIGAEIIDNLKQTLDSVERGNTPVKKIIISSGSGKQAELMESVKKISGVIIEELKLPDALMSEIKSKGASGSGWELLIGMALMVTGFSKLSLDLSKNTLQKTEKLTAIRFAKRVSYGVVSSMLLLSLSLNLVNGCKRKEVDGLRTELSTLSVLSGKQWSQTIQVIFKAVPGRLILSEFNIDSKGDIFLRGNAETRKEITVFLDTLNKLRGFKAELGYANDIQAGNKQMVQFQMKIQQKYNPVKR
ncbi:MAG: hypothetical protein A2452_13120 [Candidatus Firestonebacteria bacterium RIFOXYC2_FULL_39_67]|nr:MAG: hypothetical protein A2536_03245 [Candidatus Firestonebacteria bacterium RIFOXYD2_FULL_39_29]OGF53811.1 MAG: hypothetical protein A2497_03115 [Candidatus Firestonebacteria bacterium RifOxyC12_full_39_7]OGF56260.1 MAG: hypothetical protein A2452_13120 [Candidatus Firestonebacteria bacterium RIFOXYC2_FULL_39_67]